MTITPMEKTLRRLRCLYKSVLSQHGDYVSVESRTCFNKPSFALLGLKKVVLPRPQTVTLYIDSV